MKSLIMGLLFFSSSVFAQGNIEEPEKVSIALAGAYIPAGFDSNDRAELVIEGYFPNTCYRVGPVEKNVNSQTGEVVIRQTAYKYKGKNCLFMIVPFSQTVQVGLLKANTYKVKDAGNNHELGVLPIQTAKNSGPDDFLYANVTEAYPGTEGNKKIIVLQGELPGNCWGIKEKRVFLDGKNVLAVLPILEKTGEVNCNDHRLPFMETVEVPSLPNGRYLMHVRSLNGVAINKLIDL